MLKNQEIQMEFHQLLLWKMMILKEFYYQKKEVKEFVEVLFLIQIRGKLGNTARK